MHLRIINLDHAVTLQSDLVGRFAPEILDFTRWGPSLRLACSFRRFRCFARSLADAMAVAGETPGLSFIGSGDFHHVTLAILRQLTQPFNLLVVDKHPDWMRHVPVLHCGTWLRHALCLPNLKRVFHVGGDLDFDNLYRLLAPWPELQSGRLKIIPAHRQFRRGKWADLPHRPLMRPGDSSSVVESLQQALGGDRDDLERWPLYISLDKDVMGAREAVVNWDSGTLAFDEVRDILSWFHEASHGRLAGVDVVGDWSAVRLRPGLRTICHWSEHPVLTIDPNLATQVNQTMNEAILDLVHDWELALPARHAETAAWFNGE
jgi:hypothetical protein